MTVSLSQEFFVERAFRIFDKDGSGTVSLAEFIETMHQFSGQVGANISVILSYGNISVILS